MQARRNKGFFVQSVQHHLCGRFGGAVACKNSLGRRRAEPDSAERRHTADEAVGQRRHTFQRTAEEDAAEPGNIETAQLRQHVQCIGRVGLIFCDAAMDASIFRASPSSERPAPRPVIPSTGWPSSTAATALDVVVLPMPISPVASRPTPAFFCSCTSRMPLPMASTACSRLIAGPRVKSAVPGAMRQSRTPGTGSPAMPYPPAPPRTGRSVPSGRRWCGGRRGSQPRRGSRCCRSG